MKKKLITSLLVCGLLSMGIGYAQKFDKIDEAPTDIAYLTNKKATKPLVKVVYSRPAKESEEVFGDQVPFDQLWRTGANEATEVRFYTDMLVGNKLVRAGRYVMHTIPGEDEWTIILNSNNDTWGAFFYDPSKDVARIKVKPSEAEEIDVFSIGFKRSFKSTYMVLAWDNTRVNIPLASGNNALLAKI